MVLGGLGVTGVVAGCAAPSAPTAAPTAPAPKPTAQAPAKAKEVTKLRIGFPVSITYQAPYYVGQEKGIYSRYGIELEPVHLSDDPVILKALLSGDFQLADFNPSAKLIAISKGAPIKFVGAVAPGMMHAVGVKREIKTLRDLYGRSVGVAGGGGDLFSLIWRAVFKKEGLDVSQVQFANIGGSAQSVQALSAGKIDGGVFAIDFVPTVSRDPNVHVLFVVAERLRDMAATSLSTRDQFIQERPDVLQNLLFATVESVRYVLDHKQDTVESNARRMKQDADVVSATYDNYAKSRIWSEDGALSEGTLKFLQELNIDIGEQSSVLPVEKVANFEFQKKAVAQLGPYRRQGS